jgi:catechol 2,3-dioxygenase
MKPLSCISNGEKSSNLNEPIFDIAHLAHVELLTPDLGETLGFFKDLLGLEETERSAHSAYLRGYEEQYHHSLKVTKAQSAGTRASAWRVRTPQALQRRVTAIEGNRARERLDRWRPGTARLPV